jgi:hypothetical protein
VYSAKKVDLLDERQIVDRGSVGDDNHRAGFPELVSESSERLAIAFQVFLTVGMFPDITIFEKAVELEPGQPKQRARLVSGESACPVALNSDRFQRLARRVGMGDDVLG